MVHNTCSTIFLHSFGNNLGHRVIEISFKLKKNVGQVLPSYIEYIYTADPEINQEQTS